MGNQFHRWLLALLAWPLLPLCGMACDCPYYGAPYKAFANTPAVFVGRVVKVSTIDRKAPSGDEYKDRLVFFGDGLGRRRLWLRIPRGRRIPRLRISAPGNGKVVHGNLPTHSAAVGSSRGLAILKQEERPFPRSGYRGKDRRARFQKPNPSGRLPGGNTSVG